MPSLLSHVDKDLAATFEEHLLTTPEFAPDEPAAPAPVEEPEEPAPVPESEEPAGEEDPVVEPAPEPEVPAEEAETIDTFSELAQAYELEEQELLDHLQITGRDGEMVPLAEVVQGYRDQAQFDVTQSAEINELKTQFRSEHDKGMEELQNITLQMIEQIKSHREPEGGWEALMKTDPAEYLRLQKVQEADRYNAEQSLQIMEREKAKMVKEQSSAMERYQEEEKAKIFVLHPEWRDATAGKTAFNDIQAKAAQANYTDDQMINASAEDINTLWEAAQYLKLTKDKKVMKKRLRGLPAKHVKATARDEAAPQREQQKKRKAYHDNFRKTGKIEDAMEFFKEHIE